MKEIYLQITNDMVAKSLKKNEERIKEIFSHHYHQEEGRYYYLQKQPIIFNIFLESKENNSKFTVVSPNHSMFKEPKKVIELLSTHIYGQNHKEALKKLINGEEINIKIDIECQANKLIYFFKELFEAGETSLYCQKEIIKMDYEKF